MVVVEVNGYTIERGADLAEANFYMALVGQANLEGANLTGANLEGANLGAPRVDTRRRCHHLGTMEVLVHA